MMFVVPANPNLVEIPMVQIGCLKSEFDSTYPVHLNGIIRQDEFQESIGNINRAISSRIFLIICILIFIMCILGGFILFIVGGITAQSLSTHGFPVLIGVGFGIFFFGMIFQAFGCIILQSRRITRLRQAIANESMKYSMRSPPCSWRLLSSRFITGGYRYRRTNINYRIVIEIGHPTAPGTGNVPYQYNQGFTQPTSFNQGFTQPTSFNQGFTQPTSFFPQQNDIVPPPPYDGYRATGFCPQCGIPRQNPTAKFCTSCGQSFSI